MKLTVQKNGNVQRFVRDSAVNETIHVQDLNTREVTLIEKDDVIQVVELVFTFKELIVMFLSTFRKLFPKKAV